MCTEVADVEKAESDAEKAQPDVKKAQPDVEKVQPDVEKPQPDVEKAQPDTSADDLPEVDIQLPWITDLEKPEMKVITWFTLTLHSADYFLALHANLEGIKNGPIGDHFLTIQ